MLMIHECFQAGDLNYAKILERIEEEFKRKRRTYNSTKFVVVQVKDSSEGLNVRDMHFILNA